MRMLGIPFYRTIAVDAEQRSALEKIRNPWRRERAPAFDRSLAFADSPVRHRGPENPIGIYKNAAELDGPCLPEISIK